MTSMGMEASGKRVTVQRETDREKGKHAIDVDKDGVTPKMLIFIEDAVVKWMVFYVWQCTETRNSK